MISAIDLVTNEKGLGAQAQRAREWFRKHGPADAPPLPISYPEREHLKRGDLGHLVALYARSVALLDYNIEKHPSFQRYACGVMASGLFDPDEQNLLCRFRPRPLEGLDNGLYWNPPKRTRAGSKRSAVRRSH